MKVWLGSLMIFAMVVLPSVNEDTRLAGMPWQAAKTGQRGGWDGAVGQGPAEPAACSHPISPGRLTDAKITLIIWWRNAKSVPPSRFAAQHSRDTAVPDKQCNEHRANDFSDHSLPNLSFGSEIDRNLDRFRYAIIIIKVGRLACQYVECTEKKAAEASRK